MKFKAGTLPHLYKDRVEYLYRFQEVLRLFHNKKARDYRDGKITLMQFRILQEGWFEPRNHFLCIELNKCKKHFKQVIMDIDINNIEEE